MHHGFVLGLLVDIRDNYEMKNESLKFVIHCP